MTDAQMITIVIAIIASLGAVVYNNSRITDLRDTINRRFDDFKDAVNKRFDGVNGHIDDKFDLLMERLQRMDNNLTHQLADHETRIHKLEHPNER